MQISCTKFPLQCEYDSLHKTEAVMGIRLENLSSIPPGTPAYIILSDTVDCGLLTYIGNIYIPQVVVRIVSNKKWNFLTLQYSQLQRHYHHSCTVNQTFEVLPINMCDMHGQVANCIHVDQILCVHAV